MKNFELNNSDIRKFVKNKEFSYEYNIKYREALFVRYLNENKNITLEQVNMFINKYDTKDHNFNMLTLANLDTFSNYIKNIKFDKNSVFEVLIPAIAYYRGNHYHLAYGLTEVEKLHLDLCVLEMKLHEKSMNIKDDKQKYFDCYFNVLENYETVDLIWNNTIEMNKEIARRTLKEYANIYGEEPVELIKEHVRSLKKGTIYFGSKR